MNNFKQTLLVVAFIAAVPMLLWGQSIKLQLDAFATGFVKPVDIANAGDSRLFVVEQRGKIWIVDSLGAKSATPFLDIESIVNDNGNEQGLLGLAFHPNYAQNGYFYVSYIRSTGNSRIARFTRSAADSSFADPATEAVLLDITQPYSNHNGGSLKFGPGGYLFAGFGDGGSAGDPQGNGQKKNTHLGKILRLDVNNESAPYYTVPTTNPFVNDAAYKPEIWSLGWRNPWRFSFDRLTGDMWVGDVGQNAREEISFESATATPGQNYGWKCYEGNQAYSTTGCQPQSSYAAAIYDYPNPSKGCSVTGGFIYRGAVYNNIYGAYLFTDYCSGRWWATRRNEAGTANTVELADLTNYEYASFGEDIKGELYVSGITTGKIYKIKELCSSLALTGTATNATCSNSADGSIALTTSGGSGTYTYAWAGGTPANLEALPPATYTITVTDGNSCVRTTTLVVASNIVAPVLTANTTTLCGGQAVSITATPAPAGFGYQWLFNDAPVPDATFSVLQAIQAGSYTARFVDSSGVCTAPVSEAIVLESIEQPTISIVAGGALLCPGQSATLVSSLAPPAAGGFNYQWFLDGFILPNATSNTLVATQTGAYSVQWLNPETGCNSPVSAPQLIDTEVFLVPPVTDAGPVLSLSGTNGVTIQWLLNGQIIPNATGDTYTALVSGNYSAQIISPNGCVYPTNTVAVVVVGTQLPQSVTRFNLTPNPTSGMVQVDIALDRVQPVTLIVSDIHGRILRSLSLEQSVIRQGIDLSAQPAGTYWLTLRLDNGATAVREVVKM